MEFLWDFGDGSRASGRAVKHAYNKSGYYTVSLRVVDDSESPCNFGGAELEVWVNAPPVVRLAPMPPASVGESLHFTGSDSYDSDGEIVAYEWELGDGESKSGMNISHAYSKPGIYTVTLRMSDAADVSNSSASAQVKVFVNDPPVADAGLDKRMAQTDTLLFDATGSIDRDGSLIEYRWEFGDGWTATGKTARHRFPSPGRYNVTLTVRDNSGSSADTAIDQTIVVINDPPVADAGTDQWVTSSVARFDGGASFDRDGVIGEYRWDFGDGGTGTGQSPSHVYRDPGVYIARLTAIDDSKTASDRSADQMQVIVNHAPIADAGWML